MKNMPVSKKLILGFLMAIFMTGIVGVCGIYGMVNMNRVSSEMYDYQAEPLTYMAKVLETIQILRVSTREYGLGVTDGSSERIEKAHSTIEDSKKVMQENLDKFQADLKIPAAKTDPELMKMFEDARRLYETRFIEYLDKCYVEAKSFDNESLQALLTEYVPVNAQIVSAFNDCMTYQISDASKANLGSDRNFSTLLTLIIIVLLASVAISLFISFSISGMITKPLVPVTAFLVKAKETGDITLTASDMETIGHYAHNKDELGQLISSLAGFIERINDISKVIEAVAGGDLRSRFEALSGQDTLGNSLSLMNSNLNELIKNIHTSTSHVSSGSKQIADGAQSLAQGSTEQAAAVQQLSSSIDEIADKTKTNAEMAEKAATLAESIKTKAEKGSHQMSDMMGAVDEINKASQSISKVIKTIDDIAFQTNILALNAAIEAARAGQHGKGFAVVAEEVRNLAAKSAEAAKDTGSMIQDSIDKAELGTRIAGETSTSLIEIVEGINESSQLIMEIAESSEEQSTGITQVNTGIEQIAQVIQQNSAAAEENAATSEEMFGQSTVLEELIAQFKTKD
jgi:methyl-accepting chemotaxis protein